MSPPPLAGTARRRTWGQQPTSRTRRALLWGALLALLGVAQSLLLVLTLNHEAGRVMDDTEAAAAEAAQAVRGELLRHMQALQALAVPATTDSNQWAEAPQVLQEHSSLGRLERRRANLAIDVALDADRNHPLFGTLPRSDLQIETEWACRAAQRASAPVFSPSYFVPHGGGRGGEVVDLCVPVLNAGQNIGFVVGTIVLDRLMQVAVRPDRVRQYEFTFVEGDGTRLARAGANRGLGVFQATRSVDVRGLSLSLRANSTRGQPSLIPNLATALVLGLSLALFALVFLLAADVRRRAKAESALAEALAFRKAMEDSLSTGLRARDLQGVVTYANPAFCAMVGYTAHELMQARDTQPYWPVESLSEYRTRQQRRLNQGQAFVSSERAVVGAKAVEPAETTGSETPNREIREGFETVFVRKGGERFPVMIYEAPLVDGQGRHTGWMGAVLDLTAQRQVEELSRQQQERLQATARLATMGEMASLLSHELNQPLAAIASYASGSLNLLAEPELQSPAQLKELLQQALQRMAEQAERAGRVIKSVHDFVRRREQLHETVTAASLIEAVLPLARLQARKSGTRLDWDSATHAQSQTKVRCDRTMIEQVLLNLTRNGIQAMETETALNHRVLRLTVKAKGPRHVMFGVTDAGPGIAPDVAAKLFTPFFTTRSEGMGLGLSLCRTVVEQHGGTLEHSSGPGGVGTEFSFSLPAVAAKRLVQPENLLGQ